MPRCTSGPASDTRAFCRPWNPASYRRIQVRGLRGSSCAARLRRRQPMSVVAIRRAAQAIVLGVLAAVAFPLGSDAQVTTGSIVGTVTDPTGQTVPGAQITIEDLNKGTSVSVVSDTNGSFA